MGLRRMEGTPWHIEHYAGKKTMRDGIETDVLIMPFRRT